MALTDASCTEIEILGSELMPRDRLVAVESPFGGWDDIDETVCAVNESYCVTAAGRMRATFLRFMVRRVVITVATDSSRYPHRCPRCGGRAYVGFTAVEHEAWWDLGCSP